MGRTPATWRSVMATFMPEASWPRQRTNIDGFLASGACAMFHLSVLATTQPFGIQPLGITLKPIPQAHILNPQSRTLIL